MDSESRMEYRGAVSVGIPRQRHSGAEQPFCIVLRKRRIADTWGGHKQTVRIGDEISSPSRFLVPTGVELVPNTGLKREIGPQFDRVLNVPRAHQASPTQLRCRGHYLKAVACRSYHPLQERR